MSWFWNLFDARRKILAWQRDFNFQRPHSSLSYRTPEEFAQQWQLASPSYSLRKAEERSPQGNPAGSLVSSMRKAEEGLQTKMEMVYRYLTGQRFRQRVSAIVEQFSVMHEDLDRER